MKPIIAKAASLELLHDTAVTWRHFAPAGVTIDDCEDENYWQNVISEVGQERAAKKHAWNKIEVLALDGSWEAELRVISIDGPKVYTRRLLYWSDKAEKATGKHKGRLPNLPDGYETEYVDQNGWRSLDSVGNVVCEKLSTEGDAIRGAYAHSKPKAA